MNKSQFSFASILGLIVSVVFIWIFLFSIWYSNNILNQEVFVSKTTQVLQSEAVRNSISNEVVARVKLKMPIVGSISEPLLTKVLVGVLDSQMFTNVTTKMAQELHLQLTSANPRELSLELKPAKTLLSPIIERTDSDLLKNIPDQIVVIRKNQIPSLYKFGTFLTLAGPILLIAALIIFAFIWRKINDKRNYIAILSLIFAASGLFVYFLIPAVGNYLTAQADSVNIATIINEIYLTFTASISQFAFNILIGGIIIALVAKFVRRELFRLPERNTSKTK